MLDSPSKRCSLYIDFESKIRRNAVYSEQYTGHAVIDSIGFNHDQPNRHYANCTNYRVRVLKVTALVDVETLLKFREITAESHGLQLLSERPISRKSTAVYRNYKADSKLWQSQRCLEKR